ncbi:MAG: hypothetical protein EYC70_17215 [Planctomycetota bacterium]|nr:MAG: hypothetical protein EYC70_17215 [Planctomycetota bacterium]
MRCFRQLSFLILPAGLAWFLAPDHGEASAPGWQAPGAAPAQYLQQTPPQIWSSATGGSSRSHLPKSTLGGPIGQTCSVDTSDAGNPPRCSALSTTAGRCSAQCDAEQRCSAFLSPVGVTRRALCSTFGGTGSVCSVLQPGTPPNGPSQCSAFGGFGGTSIQCSVMRGGSSQFCSAQNPAQTEFNQCSTFSHPVVGGTGRLNCSVLSGGTSAAGNSCSVKGQVSITAFPKFCSTFAQNSSCSVLAGNTGRCTTFAAPAGTCSVFAHGSHCSVIGGASGASCHWP